MSNQDNFFSEDIKKPIRILQCVSNMDMGGIETILMNYYRNIDRTEIQFDFLCNKSKPGKYDEEIKTMGGKLYITPGLNPFKFRKYQKYMNNLFEKHPEYRVIHCQNETMGYYALKAAKINNIPVRIAHSHNTLIRKDAKYFIKKYCKFKLKEVANVEVACGKDAGEFLFGKKVKLIRNAIDTDKFEFNEQTRERIRKKFNLNNKYVIGNIARFEPQKNHEYLINIFEKFHKNNPNSILILVGEGSLMKRIKKKVCSLGLEDSVIFTGSVSNTNELYQAMDIFVLPSFHEGLPVVGIEAQTSGLPCIFSKNITKEIKINDNVDFLSINDDINFWTDRLEFYKNKKRYDMSSKILKAGYDIKVEAVKLSDWYKKLYKENKYENCDDWS